VSSAIDPLYDSLLSSPRLGLDPWSATNLRIFRPRHVLLWGQISRHLGEPRQTIADIGCHNAFFLRLTKELGFHHFIGVDFFELPPERSFLQELGEAACWTVSPVGRSRLCAHPQDHVRRRAAGGVGHSLPRVTLPTVRELVSDLPDSRILESGFVANAPSPRSGLAKNVALSIAQRTGLGHQRLLSATQYMVVQRGA
jgi:hypothetical protein